MARGLQIDALWAGLRDNNGAALAAGTVTTYAAGTTTPQSIYSDVTCLSAIANPATLDGYGRLHAYGAGDYKFLIRDSLGNTIQTLDNLRYATYDGLTAWTPTITASGSMTISGTPTINYAKYLRFGKIVRISISVTLTTAGTASSTIYLSLPTGLNWAQASIENQFASIEFGGNVTPGFWRTDFAGNATKIEVFRLSDTTTPNFSLAAHTIVLSGFYETVG